MTKRTAFDVQPPLRWAPVAAPGCHFRSPQPITGPQPANGVVEARPKQADARERGGVRRRDGLLPLLPKRVVIRQLAKPSLIWCKP